MVLTEKIVIPALSDEERRAYVYIPTEYNSDDKKRYPVLYMFDGHNVFFDEDATYGKSWGMGDYLDWTDTPVIVAAVECSHIGNGRLEEYSPFSFHDKTFGDIRGRGKETMEWLVNEFKPAVDQNFKTKRGRENTFIAGSSMGGLMALYAISAYNHVFSRAAALSPSLWVNKKGVLSLFSEYKVRSDTVLYLDYGSKELANHNGMKAAIGELTAKLIRQNINITTRIIKGGEHTEASWERQIPVFLRCLGF